jgi:hypothetical protein
VLAGGKAKWRRGCGVVKSSGGLIGRHASFPRTGTWISTRIYFLRTSRERRHSHWALPVWTMAVSIYNTILQGLAQASGGNSCSLWLQAPSVALSCPAQHVKSEVLTARTTTNDKHKHVIGQIRPRHSSTTAIRDTDLRRWTGPRLASTGQAIRSLLRSPL